MSELSEQVFSEAAIEVAARAWVGAEFDKWRAADDPGHDPIFYGQAIENAAEALAAAVNADPRAKACLRLAALSDEEQRRRVLRVLESPPERRREWPHGYGYEQPDEPFDQWRERIAAEVLAALGLPAEQESRDA
jgi:hypothetical protein